MLKDQYKVSHHETREWGSLWCGPDELKHGEATLIARLVAESDDGYDVEVFCTAMPARFYAIHAIRGGQRRVLETGSGMAEYARATAFHLARGMLRIG